MLYRSYESKNQGGGPDPIVALLVSIVIFTFVLAGVADTNLYSVKTMEGIQHRLSLWNGESCTMDGCLTQKLPPIGWCGERRTSFTAMQVFSIISLAGSVLLLLSSLLGTLTVRTHCIRVFFFGSATLTWLFLMIEWSMMAGIFHSKACSNPSFSEIKYQYGASFALFLMAWTCLTAMAIYSGIVRVDC
ncbi:hypothetical protein DQ04_05921030 [Trypanosoma grayi]|uniref:hypothetical protein n=1 Tax=Trypanosoma grayi TaxID=71804 RepID=UPI0004F499C2|nr:hypothetical protein DQ04_05921030 [Trypanosoma grayi]KEG09048.1 hypothetical protein DQ04_05921030 [Trypanosoma grayi]